MDKKNVLDEYALPNIIKQSIIDEIMKGEVKVGDKLVEAKYSEQFGTSRAPVREAFYLLNMEGYVQKIPRKGTVVKDFSTEEMRDVLEIRNFLEQLAIERIDQKEMDRCLQKMREIVNEMDNSEIDLKLYAKLNYEFHLQLIIASRSEVIQNAYGRLASPLISLQTISFMKQEAIEKSLVEHKQIVNYLANGQMDQAKILLDLHNKDVFPRIKESM
jgi:DNA-binding GntR family transcriptional regulator